MDIHTMYGYICTLNFLFGFNTGFRQGKWKEMDDFTFHVYINEIIHYYFFYLVKWYSITQHVM